MRNTYSTSSGTTAFLLESQIPGALRWINSGFTFVAVLPRVRSSPAHVQEVVSMNLGELLISLSSALATMLRSGGGNSQVPLGDIWAFDGEGTSVRLGIALTLSAKNVDTRFSHRDRADVVD